MSRNKLLFSSFMLIVPAGVVLVLYGYLGNFTRFLADDFCSAYYARRLGLLRSVWYWYINWSGRYTAFGADWLMEKIGAYSLPVVPPLALLVWLVSTALAIHLQLRCVLHQGRSMVVSLSLGTVFLFVVLLLSPNIPQSLYWWNGMRSYSLPLIGLAVYSVVFQVGVERFKTKKEVLAGSLISFIFMFANGGLGEIYVVFQLVLLGCLLALEWLVHRDKASHRFLYLLACLAGSVAAMILVLSSPGNAIRQSYFPPHPDVVTLFQTSIKSYLDFIFEIILSPEKVTGLLGALLATIWLGGQSEPRQIGNYLPAYAAFLGAFILSFVCFLPGVYATSEPSPTRAFTIPVFAFVACFFHTGFIVGQRFADRLYPSNPIGNSLFMIAVLLITYSALIEAQDLFNSRGMYIEFAQKWDETDALILKAEADNLDTVQIPAMDNWAGLDRPTDNKRYWPNVCYSLYYDIQVFGPPYP